MVTRFGKGGTAFGVASHENPEAGVGNHVLPANYTEPVFIPPSAASRQPGVTR